MKKISALLGILLLSSSSSLWAQYNKVNLPEKPNRPQYVDHTQCEKGFWCAAEFEGGSTVMLNHCNMQSAQITYTAGYRFNEFLKIGAGVGSKYYVSNNDRRRGVANSWTFPIYANIRGNLISQVDRSMVPYWSVNIGSVINDGFFVSPSLGLRFGEQRNSWMLGVSYSYNQIKTKKLEAPATKLKSTSALLLHVGYEF